MVLPSGLVVKELLDPLLLATASTIVPSGEIVVVEVMAPSRTDNSVVPSGNTVYVVLPSAEVLIILPSAEVVVVVPGSFTNSGVSTTSS